MALEFLEELPSDVPSSLPVYRLREFDGSAGPQQLSDVAHQLGLEGRAHEITTSGDWTIHQEGVYQIAVHGRSGALIYRNRAKAQRPSTEPFELDDDASDTAARRFLDRAGLLSSPGDSPAREDSTVVGVTHLRTSGGDREGRERREEVVLDAGVVYGRVVDDIPVDGPGGNMMVNVDPTGDVIGLRRVWRPLAERAADVRVLSPERAYDAMKRIAERVRGDTIVRKARFGYFELGPNDRQSHLQPAYMMVYVVTDRDVAYKSAEVVTAGERAFEKVLGDRRFPAQPQKKRERPAKAGG